MRTFEIARRYLLGKKSTNAINIITGISVIGIAVGTAALILVMSVLNGFEHLIKGLINSFNPDFKITLAEGKTFEFTSDTYTKLAQVPNVSSVVPYLEETALLEYKGVKDFATLKGVDTGFVHQTVLTQKMETGNFDLKPASGHGAVLGIGIRNKLAVSIDDVFASLMVYMPDPKGSTFQPFKKRVLQPTGVFSVQQEYDNKYVFVDLLFLQELLDKPDHLSGFEIKLIDYHQKETSRQAIQKIVGSRFVLKDRFQQDAAFYKLMRLEKWVSYAILSFVLVLVAFNIVGALWMVVLDKKKDILVLKAIGMKYKQVRNIFLETGLLIVILGIVIGFVLSIVIYLIHQRYGIVPMPEGFLVDRYPIKLAGLDFVVVAFTVLTIGFIASLLPANKAAQLKEQIRYE